MRRRRSCAVLGSAAGGIDVDTMMSVLRDHSNASEPNEPFRTSIDQGGICVHFKHDENGDVIGGNTAASLVADLCGDGSRLPVYWCSFYSPCLSLFYPVFIQAELAAVLAKGGQHPESDPESPWWGHNRLNVAAREGGTEEVHMVRRRWQKLQGEMMSTAYDVAAEGKRLIDEGESEEAAGMLTRYVDENVGIMLDTVEELTDVVGRGVAAD
jgi:secernin